MNVEFYNLIKSIAKATVDESKPVAFCYGTVESASPLKIRLNQKMIIPDSFLIVSEACRDTECEIIIDGIRKKIKVLKRLKKGEKVLLIRYDSGQKYYVVGRIDSK